MIFKGLYIRVEMITRKQKRIRMIVLGVALLGIAATAIGWVGDWDE
mgnify:CR=1 FL=1